MPRNPVSDDTLAAAWWTIAAGKKFAPGWRKSRRVILDAQRRGNLPPWMRSYGDELVAAWRTLVVEENPPAPAVRKARQVMLDAQRSATPPPLWVRRFIADSLQRHYSSALARKGQARQVKAAGYEAEIVRLVREHGGTRTKAKKKLVANPKFGLKSAKALDQYLRRAKLAHK
jgi:hypothetical protein